MTSVLHVHVVGDAKAGKSLAVKWMIHMLEARNRKTIEMREAKAKQKNSDLPLSKKKIKKQKDSINVAHGRTRGVRTTTVTVANERKGYPSTTYIIHDYGGQEEFLSHHANFMSVANSLYVVVVPLAAVGEHEKDVHPRSTTAILDRYLYWLRFVFSVVCKQAAFPQIETHIDNTKSESSIPSFPGIPMITVLNTFVELIGEKAAQSQLNCCKPFLKLQLHNLFAINNTQEVDASDEEEETIPLPDGDYLMPAEDFLEIDNSVNLHIEQLLDTIWHSITV